MGPNTSALYTSFVSSCVAELCTSHSLGLLCLYQSKLMAQGHMETRFPWTHGRLEHSSALRGQWKQKENSLEQVINSMVCQNGSITSGPGACVQHIQQELPGSRSEACT